MTAFPASVSDQKRSRHFGCHGTSWTRTPTCPTRRPHAGRSSAIGTLGFVLAQTTVIPALGDLQRELGASASGIAWMVTAYLLVASIATPIFGRLGDMFGKERLLAISLALFAVGSVVCALRTRSSLMIVGRGLQGLGGGVFPLSFGIIRDEFPRAEGPDRHRAARRDRRDRLRRSACRSAACSSTGRATTGSSGSPRSWASLATITTIRFVPESPIRTPGRVDFAGAGILAVGLTALLIAISRGADWGWGSAADARPDRRRPRRARRCFGVFERRTPRRW